MTTYRERREARAERLEEWADKRESKARAIEASLPEYRHDNAFITQPGAKTQRLRDKVNARETKAWEHQKQAKKMQGWADTIKGQLDHAIYDDDPDAIERLRERIGELEAKRDRIKAQRRARGEGEGAVPRTANLGGADIHYAACPACGWTSPETRRPKNAVEAASAAKRHNSRCRGVVNRAELTNLSANIRRNKQRLERLEGVDR